MCGGAGVASKPTATVACPACRGTGCAHYDGQLGSEATPGEFIDNLIACTADWLKVLKPTGSLFVNLGDKYANAAPSGSAGRRNWDSADLGPRWATGTVSHDIPPIRTDTAGIKAKSRMGLPWRYAIRCIDQLGLILRADIIWSKPNGLPESVTDRVRMSHEYLFHFTRQGRYFAAIDEVREAYLDPIGGRSWRPPDGAILGRAENAHGGLRDFEGANPLGKAPGSVWTIPSEPLSVPDHLGVDHFAAYPSELVRRCVLGWTPSGWCTACGEALHPITTKEGARPVARAHRHLPGYTDPAGEGVRDMTYQIEGYSCSCKTWTANAIASARTTVPNTPTTPGPTAAAAGNALKSTTDVTARIRPAVVLDPFAGTGTTVLVADQLGRHGIGTDLSADYLRLAEWRIRHDTHTHRKVRDRSGLATPQPPAVDGQLGLFEAGHAG